MASSDSQTELLNWINPILHTNYVKIEELCTGAAYCQLTNLLFDGCIQLEKVIVKASMEHEYIYNFKILQAGLRKAGTDKIIPIDGLISGQFKDNLEFCQWFKAYFDANYGGGEY